MSNPDSFIEEVTEEVRREKLYGYLRRYGWIGVVCVLGLVGGAAWNEYRNAQARDVAQTTGDALLSALEQDALEARVEAMMQISADGAAAAVALMLQAATQEEAGDTAAALQILDALAVNQDVPEMYRDLAAIKAVMLPSEDVSSRLSSLQALAQPGQPFRLLALEQIAYITLADGDVDGAIGILRQIEEDAGVSRGLRERVQTLMVALGEPLPGPVTQ